MKIGIIGAGGIGKAFARIATKAGYETLISNSRGADSLAEFVKTLGPNITATSVEDAAKADVVFLALLWKNLQQVTTSINTWENRIVIDPANPIITPDLQVAPLDGKTSSEVVAQWVKGARLVKAFNTLSPEILSADPQQSGGRRVIFYSGDDAGAKEVVAGIIQRAGFAGVDLGGITEGGRMQQFPGGPLPGLNLIQLT